MRGLLLILLGFGLLLLPLGGSQGAASAFASPPPHIQGTSKQGWTIDVQGSRGIFTADGERWQIELLHRGLGQAGFVHLLWFLGRKPDNYVLVFAHVNTVGDSFFIWYFDYKQAVGRLDAFKGSYSVNGMRPQPTPIEDYVPVGRVPDYIGADFRVTSRYAQVTPAEGTIAYRELRLTVYPIYQAVVSEQLSEFWAVGVPPQGAPAYHLIFNTRQSETWVLNLADGELSLLPLGQAVITGGQVRLSRSISLGPKNEN